MEILNFKGPLLDLIYILKKGGSIRIKKKNRGKFTDYCGGKVTEECIAKGKKSKDPKIRKRATFAANARKWKHENGGPLRRPNFKESKEAYYDPETDTVFAPDSLGEFYHHEMFHARPNLQLLESLKPYYHNLNDDVLKQMGADLSFVKRFNNDPGHFYSPEELGARVVSASEILNRMGVKDVTLDFLKNARLNENIYGDNFRDLLHMYNDDNLIKIFNAVKKHENGGIIKYQNPSDNLPPLIQRVNKSKANFVQRLLDPNRKSIQNWVNPLSISTHKLGWATENTKQGAFVYPEVQEINGELIDFTHPSHRRSEGINSAIERRDTVRMTPEQAKWFTENYKQYYPGFKDGGILKAQGGTGNLYAPHPLSPIGIALNQAKAMAKGKKDQQHLPPGVKQVVGPDGKKVAIRTEQPLVPLEQSIAEYLPGTGDVAEVGYIANDVKNGNLGSATLGAGLMFLPGAAARKVIDLNGIKKVNVKLEDPTKYWYVAHQTGSSNFSKIAQDGLQTGSGLNGTALYLTEEYMDDFANGRLKQKHLSHEGADGLVVMKFPKDKFPSGDLDDISIRLMDLGESNSFEVPPEYLQFFKRDQLKNGGKL